MSKFRETELTEKLKKFQSKSSVEIDFEKSINGKINIENASISYNYECGYIEFLGKNIEFKINTAMVYTFIEKNENIYIDLENTLIIIKYK